MQAVRTTLALSLTVIPMLLLPVALGPGCSSTDSPTDASTDAGEGGVDLCALDAFTGNGNPCHHVSTKVCFKLCTNGGCTCVQGSSGPVWKCVNDFSCYADGSPLDDASPTDDAGLDAGTD